MIFISSGGGDDDTGDKTELLRLLIIEKQSAVVSISELSQVYFRGTNT